MAQPTPPPYVDVTGIARTDMKINKQETIAEYDGNARPGELVVDLTTYNLYIGNADGNLNGFTGGGGTNYANANLVSYLNTGLAGNIIPSANNVYSLGSPTRQWASIYVSANTLYLGATAVSSDGTGLLIGGEAVVTANTPITGNVEADYFIGDGSLLTNLPTGNYSNSNVANYLPTYSGNVTTITATGTIYAVGNVAGNVFIGNGSQLTGIVTNYSNANVANYLPTYSGNITAGNISLTGRLTATTELIGPAASANFTRFPNAQVVISNVAANIQVNELGPTGLIAEAVGNPANTTQRGVGVYGVGYTSGAAGADGVSGEAHVSDAADTGTATAVRGYADSTHSGTNIGLYSSAIGGDINYALYMKHGNILSFDQQAWTVVANTANALTIGSATSANLLVVNTAANVIDMSSTLSVAGNVRGGNINTAGSITAAGNIATAGNVSITGTVDIVGNITSGNILPAANNVYSLGSPTMLWSNLYVSSNTIYFGTVPVSVSETGMEIGNSAVVTAGTTTSGNVSADNFIGNLVLNSNIAITSTGTDSININSNDNIFLRGVDPLIGTATEGGDINIYGGDGSDADITGNSASGGDITIYGGDGGVGNLSFEGGDGGTIRIEGGIGANAYQDVGNSVYTSAKTGGDVLITGGNAGNNAGNTALGANGGSIFLYAGDATAEYTYGGIFLRGSQVQVQTESAIWNYNYEGNLTLPSTPMANIKGNTVNFITTTALNLQSNATINVQSNVSNITLSVLNANAVAQNFTYDNTGNLTIPNSINAASNTDPLIAGFSFEGGYVSVTGLVAGGYVRTLPTDVANLIPAGTANIAEQGTRAFVTDADSRTWGNLVTGGGANAVPIWTDGTDWYIG
jgi:hypothetical protein